MQFSKSAGKHWTELSGSLSVSLSPLLFFYFPTSRPVSSLYPSPPSTFLSPPFILRNRRILSRGGGGTLSAFQTVALGYTRAAPISTFFFDEI